jgi:TonB-linked SusC/RagA family outer membrane protein
MRSWCISPRTHAVRPPGPALGRMALWTLMLGCGLGLAPQNASAQQGAIAGAVTAAGTQEAMAGAQILVTGTTLRTTTDESGRFRFGTVPGTNVTLEVRRIGYKLARVPARVGDENVQIVLTLNPTSLEAVVVTGTPGAAQKRELGNSVGQINVADVVANAPIVSMQSLLNGRTPGLVIMPASGQVGSGSQIRIRGQASFSLGNNPLLYVDGVRVNNEPTSGFSNQAFGSSSISRLNDFNPEDIESIEVLKGPSAATLYGTEAANGVINIITKKGSAGALRWNAVVRQGVNYLADWKTMFPTNYGRARLTTDGTSATGPVVALDFDSLLVGACGDSIATRMGKKCDIFRTGAQQETELSVSGGSSTLNYYASGNLMDAQGAEPRNNKRTYSGRLNVGFAPSDRFRVATNVGYVTGPTHLPCEAGCGGYVWTTLYATPNNYNLGTRHGYHSWLPYQYDRLVQIWQDVERTTASVRFEHQPRTWLSHRMIIGGDRTREGNNWLQPRMDSLQYQAGSGALGYRAVTARSVTDKSLDYNANAIWNYSSDFRFTTSVGAQYYHETVHSVYAEGSVFPAAGLTSVSSTTQSRFNSENFVEDKSLGVYAQEQVGWRDRMFFTAALRSDDHSAFGSKFTRVTYPKYSLSWVLSEEPWFQVPGLSNRLSELRLRVAYGESGKAPSTYSAIRTYTPATGPANSAAVTPNSIGNPELGPEKGKEVEIGFDASALQDRLGVEFTYYDKKTIDAILNKDLAPSTGQSGSQPINIGRIDNSGIELMLRGTPWRSERVGLDLTASVATNANEVSNLGLGSQYFVSAGQYLRHQVGFPAFAWFEQKVLSTAMDRTTGLTSNTMCADTLPGSGGRMGGAPRLCAGNNGVYGDADDAPEVYLGRSVPPREFAFSGTLTLFNRFRVFSMIDMKNGHKKMDGNTRVRCGLFGRCKENFTTIVPEFAQQADSMWTAQARSNSNLVDFLITDASFAKWRELTFSYDVPERYVRMARATRATISVSGRNLATWTNFIGFEPEAMFLGGSRGGNAAWEQSTLPQLRSWIVTLNLGF